MIDGDEHRARDGLPGEPLVEFLRLEILAAGRQVRDRTGVSGVVRSGLRFLLSVRPTHSPTFCRVVTSPRNPLGRQLRRRARARLATPR